MAKAKLNFKTPLAPLAWVSVRGKGKLKMDKDPNSEDPNDYNYTATVTLSKAQATPIIDALTTFWRDNKPKGVGKQKYSIVKEEFIKKTDANGKVLKDADDEPIKVSTGNYIMQAKTMTKWPDGNPNIIKLLGSAGQELPAGHPLEDGCGQGTMGIIHGSIGINSYSGNEGLMFYLNGIQIKESTYKPYSGGGIEADSIDDDVAPADVPDTQPQGADKPNI